MLGHRGKPASPTQQGLVIGAAFFVAYLLTRTRDLGGDETVFASAVDGLLHGKGIPRELFHPHHPLFNPIVAAVAWLARLLGFHPIVADVGAGVAAFFAAAVVAALVPLLRGAGIRESHAMLAAGVAGASGGLWQYGTRMEVCALTAAVVLLWLAVVGRARPDPLASGGALAASILGHLAAGLLAVPTAVRFARRPRAMVAAIGVGLGLAGFVLAALFVVFHHAYSPAAWLALVRPRYAGGYIGPSGHGTAAGAVADLAVWRWYRGVPVFPAAAARWLDVGAFAASVVLVVVLVAGAIAAVRDRQPMAVTAALGIAAYVPLWLVWDVGNVEHTVAATPLFATLVAFGAAALPKRSGTAALGAALGLLLLVNGVGSALPQSRPENCREWVIASFVAESVPKDGVLLTVGVDPRQRLALPYLSGRRVVTLALDVDSARNQGRPLLDGLAYWMQAGREASAIWLTPDVLSPASVRWLQGVGVPPEVWLRVLKAARPVERRVLPPDGVALREPFVLTRITIAR